MLESMDLHVCVCVCVDTYESGVFWNLDYVLHMWVNLMCVIVYSIEFNHINQVAANSIHNAD